MNICLFALGTRGDVAPFVALARGLQQAGHAVQLAAGRNFAAFAAEHGVPFVPLAADYQQLMQTEAGRGAVAMNPLAIRNAIRLMQPVVREVLDEVAQVAEGADLLVAHPKVLGVADVAQARRVPLTWGVLQPLLIPTSAFPAPGVPAPPFGGWLNRLTYRALRMAALPFHQTLNAWRRERLGLPVRTRFTDPFLVDGKPCPVLHAFSPQVVPPPADWPESAQVTGYWFLDKQDAYTPPPELVRFLEDGPPPVYVGFGSMAATEPERMTRCVLDALRQSGQRGIAATGWGGLKPETAPPDVFVLDAAPHDWLFPRCRAVVHHGGAGTTAAGLRAGRPTVVCPFFGDQGFWGARVAALGAGPAPIPQRNLTAATLARAIRQAATDSGMAEKARHLGAQLQAEDGVANAVAVLEKYGYSKRANAG